MALTELVRVDETRPPFVLATMDAAATRNRLGEAMVAQLTEALGRAERNPGTKVFALRAAGDTFCSGLALSDIGQASWRPRVAAVRNLLTRLMSSDLITVACVDGPATGGGVGLATACDQVIVGRQGGFRMTEVLLGLVPAVVLPVVARRVGEQRAFSLALSAREVRGAEAVRLGLADDWSEDAAEGLRHLLIRLHGADHGAVRALKRYRRELFAPVPDREDLMERVLDQRLSDPQARERLARFAGQGLLP